MRVRILLLSLLVAAAGCRTGRNYPAEGPRYAGAAPAGVATPAPVEHGPVPLRIVSFNIERALRVDTAIEVLRGEDGTRGADVLLLQEMDAEGTQKVAAALGYVEMTLTCVRCHQYVRDEKIGAAPALRPDALTLKGGR